MKFFRAIFRSQYSVVIAEVLLLTLFNLGTFSVLVRLTDAKTIGLWVLLNSLLSFSKVADIWSAGLVTFVAEDHARKNLKGAAQLVFTALITAACGFLIVVLVLGPLLYFFSDHIPGVADAAQVRAILPLMCFTFWLTTTGTIFHIGFLGLNRPGFKLIQNAGGAFLFLVMSLFLVGQMGIWGILLAQCVQSIVMFCFGFVAFRYFVIAGLKFDFWSRADFQRLTGFGAKASVVGFLQIATEPLTKLMMSTFGGLDAVTLMEVTTRIIVAVRGIIISTGQVLVPAFARGSLEGNAKLAQLYGTAVHIFTIVTVPVLAVLLAMGPLLERLMLGSQNALFLPMLWLLSFGWAVNILSAPAFFLLSGLRRLRPLFCNRFYMLLAVLILGAAGGKMWGVLGVTFGVSLGLIGSGAIAVTAAQTFSNFTRGGIDVRYLLRCCLPVILAAISTLLSLEVQRYGFGFAGLLGVTAFGSALTTLCSFAVLPLRRLVYDLLNTKVL